jgi:hypothetical protein
MRPFEVRGRPIGRCEAAKGGRWCQACEYGLLLVFSPLLRARLAENKSASSPFLALACSVSTFQGIWPAKRLGGSTIEWARSQAPPEKPAAIKGNIAMRKIPGKSYLWLLPTPGTPYFSIFLFPDSFCLSPFSLL